MGMGKSRTLPLFSAEKMTLLAGWDTSSITVVAASLL